MLSQTLGLQNVRESVCWSLPKAVCFIRRLYSSPSFNRQPPAKGVYNGLEAGVYRGLARYAWLRMVRNQVEVCFNDAIRHVDTAVMIDAGRCAGCGACAGACRHEYIVLAGGFARFS